MKKGLIRLLALMLALLLVLGAAAGCGKKPSSDTKGKDTVTDEDTSGNVDQGDENGTDNQSDVSNDTGSDEATDETVNKDTGDENKDDSKDATTDEKKEDTKTGDKSTTTTATKTTKTTTPTKTTATKPTGGTTGKVDLKGYTVKVACWWNLDPKVPSNVYYEKAVQREKEVRAKYNIKFQWINVPGQGLRDKIASSVMAGDPVGDICRCRSGWVLPTLAGKGYIEPADKYFDVSDPLWNPVILKESMYKGRPMGVNHQVASFMVGMLYNRSMMQRLGLADPQTLVASKKWTFDKFEEYCKAIAKDTDGDGKLDVFGTNFPAWQQVVACNGGKIVSEINGKDVFTLNRPEAVEALKWIQELVKMNVIGGDMAAFANGKVGFYWWWSWVWDFKSTMKDKFGLLPPPMGPKAKDYAAWTDEVHLMCIPANSKHPKEVAAIWRDYNAWYPGVSGRDQMYRDNLENNWLDKRDVDMAIMLSSKFWLDKYFAYNDVMAELWPGGGNDIENVIEGTSGKTIDQFLGQIASKCQNSIDQLWASFSK